ncbi:DNA (cytosine-5)-methyltransferase 3B-like [Zingiber officinale]|uniref:DNA (cytosine-5)-methyltransferase 3B-like n=1 Tax=Zingiber officinale TaxID=94328 RepID=UPI001C4C6A08|nr:DNA (cytosine-5)-methyltransferase 3B-like [Zingiber officinale]XP_042427200.1 DNA (cytosine-5)-methyltransferase 3B-like [Zingiber officinale]
MFFQVSDTITLVFPDSPHDRRRVHLRGPSSMEHDSHLVFDSAAVPRRRRQPGSRRVRSNLPGSISDLLNCNSDSFCTMSDWQPRSRNEPLSIDTDKTGSNSNDRVGTHSSAQSPISSDGSLCSTERKINCWLSPGNVVWAKTAVHEWWPAEIMDDKSIESTRDNLTGHVLVQLYGSEERSWLEPDRDVSQFDQCFEERSKNPLQTFQDALKQALSKRAHLSPKASPNRHLNGAKISYQPEKCDTWQSSRKTSNSLDVEGRGQRKRKVKVHFDEMSRMPTSKRKVRRLRIMRYLGLMAPIGSPFSLQH